MVSIAGLGGTREGRLGRLLGQTGGGGYSYWGLVERFVMDFINPFFLY